MFAIDGEVSNEATVAFLRDYPNQQHYAGYTGTLVGDRAPYAALAGDIPTQRSTSPCCHDHHWRARFMARRMVVALATGGS